MIASYENKGVLDNVHHKYGTYLLVHFQHILNLFDRVPRGDDALYLYFRKNHLNFPQENVAEIVHAIFLTYAYQLCKIKYFSLVPIRRRFLFYLTMFPELTACFTYIFGKPVKFSTGKRCRNCAHDFQTTFTSCL